MTKELKHLKQRILDTKSSVPEDEIRGVYLLMDGEEVVYVGKSQNCRRRIGNHLSSGSKEFDGFYIHAHPDGMDLCDLEAHLIYLFAPKYNRVPPKSNHYVSPNRIAKHYKGCGPIRVRKILDDNGIVVRGGLAPATEARAAIGAKYGPPISIKQQ